MDLILRAEGIDVLFLHASCVAIGEKGVLLSGPPGAGKSDVALRLIDGGAGLVADDQTSLSVREGALWAAPPETIAGLIEVRGVGLLRLPYCKAVKVALFVDLVEMLPEQERVPEPAFHSLLDCSVRALRLSSRQASTPSIIRVFLQRIGEES